MYKGIKSGDLKVYIAKTAVETLAQDNSLTPTQKEMLNSGDLESLAEDIEENITPKQVDCATQAVVLERANQLMIINNPTPQEILKLSKCL